MNALRCVLLLLGVCHFCVGNEIVIYQSRSVGPSAASWRVRRVATVSIGADSYFNCSVDGNAVQSTTLEWLAVDNFTSVSQVSSFSGQLLNLSNVQLQQIGQYICRDNASGNSVYLMITKDSPFILADQSRVEVEEGQRTDLIIYTSGNPTPPSNQIHWRKDGLLVSGPNLLDENHRLRIDNAQLYHAGVYNVSVIGFLAAAGGVFIRRYVIITLEVYVRPVVLSHPMNLTIDEWTTVQLECRFSGVPVPDVAWLSNISTNINEMMISSNVTGNEVVSWLTFSKVRVSDAGLYWCRASSDVYSYVATTIPSVLLVTPQLLISQVSTSVIPVDTLLTVYESQTVMLSCQGSGSPLWYNTSGELVSMATTDQVYQAPIDVTNQRLYIGAYVDSLRGKYTCRSNTDSLPLERSVVLTTDNPSVFSNVSELYPVVGSHVQLVVHVSGHPVPQASDIMWYLDNILITNQTHPRLTLSDDHTQLIIDNIRDQYYGVYQCNVTTSAGSRDHSFAVMQPFPPSVAINPSSRDVAVGDSTHFTCQATGTEPLTIGWRFDNLSNLPTGVDVNNDVITFGVVEVRHGGTYSCVVTNLLSTVIASATLNVQVPPQVMIRTQSSLSGVVNFSVELSSGTTAPVIVCTATGIPPPEVSWRYGSSSTLPDRVQQIVDSDGTVTLRWSRILRYTDTGLYRCVATNVLNTSIGTANLTVTAAAMVTAINPTLPTTGSVDSFVTPIGQSGVIVSCLAFGSPQPEVRWVSAVDGMSLPNDVTSVTSLSGSHDPNYVVAQLKWRRNFAASDAGVYKCIASNSAGNNSLSIAITTAVDTPPTADTPSPPPNNTNELFVQLRILLLSCSQWKTSIEAEEYNLGQVHSAILNSLKLQCNCLLNDGNLVSDSLSCSSVVDNSTLYRARLRTAGNHTASVVYTTLLEWVTIGPSVVINNIPYKIDANCDILADSADQSECSTVSTVEDDGAAIDQTLLFGAIGLAAVVLICTLLLVGLMITYIKCRHSAYNFTRTFSRKMSLSRTRGGSGVYVSNSFQGLNHFTQGTIMAADTSTIRMVANGRTDEVEDINVPEIHQNGNAPVENPYDLPNNPVRFVQVQRSPRLSSESRITTDSGIHSRTHSCDRLLQSTSSDVPPPLVMMVHRPLGYSKSEEINFSPLNDTVSVFSDPRTPMKRRQPSFDDICYLTGEEIRDTERRSGLSNREHISHSQPLEMLDYPNHQYIFTEQQDSYSQPIELSQSYPSTSHFHEGGKLHPEPYVEPVSLRSSQHSILAQNSQLDTMV